MSPDPRSTQPVHCLLAVSLAGALMLGPAAHAQAFGWEQRTLINADTGANAIAVHEIAEHMTYRLDSECTPEPVIVMTLEIGPQAHDTDRAKYLPPTPASSGQPGAVPVEVKFDNTQVSTNWPGQITTTAEGTTTFRLRFDKQRYYTRKVERLFESSQYLNLKVNGASSSEAFTTSVPLTRLKGIFGKVTACPPVSAVADSR